MTCGAALAGAALAAGVSALSTLASSSATLSIASPAEGGWPQIPGSPGFQNGPSEAAKGGTTFLLQELHGLRIVGFDASDDPLAPNELDVGRVAADARRQRPGDSLALVGWPAPDAIALNGAGETTDNPPQTASSTVAPAQSLWARLLIAITNR